MTDSEIKEYLRKNNWKLDAQDYFKNIFNTSPQIINEVYDFKNRIMTITTSKNTFIFKWNLNNL